MKKYRAFIVPSYSLVHFEVVRAKSSVDEDGDNVGAIPRVGAGLEVLVNDAAVVSVLSFSSLLDPHH